MPVQRTPSDGSPVSADLRTLFRSLIDTGGRSVGIRFGSSTVSWAAAATSTTATVTHGLGRAPVGVFVQVHDSGAALYPRAEVFTVGATTFDVQFKADGTPTAANVPFYWIVIG